MAERASLAAGTRVRVRPSADGPDLVSDLQVPRYVWERIGTVDRVLQHKAVVRFRAEDLWGDGEHHVTVVVPRSYLEPVG